MLVAYVGTLKRFSIFLNVLAGYLLFHEFEFKHRLWAAGLIFAGIICPSFDNLPNQITTHFGGLGL